MLQLRTYEVLDDCPTVVSGSFLGWTTEQRVMPIAFSTEDVDYPLLYRDVSLGMPSVGVSYNFVSAQTGGVSVGVHSIAADMGQGMDREHF